MDQILDRVHAFHDGKVRFVTVLGETNTPFGWRKGMADGGIVMEVPSGRVIGRGLRIPGQC